MLYPSLTCLISHMTGKLWKYNKDHTAILSQRKQLEESTESCKLAIHLKKLVIMNTKEFLLLLQCFLATFHGGGISLRHWYKNDAHREAELKVYCENCNKLGHPANCNGDKCPRKYMDKADYLKEPPESR